MTHNFKPGDVAMVGVGIGFMVEGGAWYHADESWTPGDCKVLIRPLIVIDPEDREQVERLSHYIAAAECGDGMAPLDAVQAALREIADPKPPKPAEPTGWLAAVEEPGRDRRWYRDGALGGSEHPWRQYRLDGVVAHDRWEDLPRTVRVLSEGVPS